MFAYVRNCVRVACARTELRLCCRYEYKTTNALLARRMHIQNVTLKIHFPVPKCSCKQGTTNVLNNGVEAQRKHITSGMGCSYCRCEFFRVFLKQPVLS